MMGHLPIGAFSWITPITHRCGWVLKAGQGIPCDDQKSGPFYCPQCREELHVLPVVNIAPEDMVHFSLGENGLLAEAVRCAVAEEREACARILDNFAFSPSAEGVSWGGVEDSAAALVLRRCVDAIRGRGRPDAVPR